MTDSQHKLEDADAKIEELRNKLALNSAQLHKLETKKHRLESASASPNNNTNKNSQPRADSETSLDQSVGSTNSIPRAGSTSSLSASTSTANARISSTSSCWLPFGPSAPEQDKTIFRLLLGNQVTDLALVRQLFEKDKFQFSTERVLFHHRRRNSADDTLLEGQVLVFGSFLFVCERPSDKVDDEDVRVLAWCYMKDVCVSCGDGVSCRDDSSSSPSPSRPSQAALSSSSSSPPPPRSSVSINSCAPRFQSDLDPHAREHILELSFESEEKRAKFVATVMLLEHTIVE